MRSQALGLAEAVGLPIVEKQVTPRSKLQTSMQRLWPDGFGRRSLRGDALVPPWPKLAIACGGSSVEPTLFVKRLSGGRTFAVYVQNPQAGLAKFDLVVAMPHDGIEGPNVVEVRSTLHRITEPGLTAARDQWRGHLVPGAQAVLGALVGGDMYAGRDRRGGYRLTQAVTQQLIAVLKSAHAGHGLNAAITPSRRTGAIVKQAIAQALATDAFGTMWNEKGENPYVGILGLAERLIVTGESISMISEALATGRPVHVLPLEGHAQRQEAFLERMVQERRISLIEGDDLDWSFAGSPPINSTIEIAERVHTMLNATQTARAQA
jgi:mitochondrial fission protein ELM1